VDPLSPRRCCSVTRARYTTFDSLLCGPALAFPNRVSSSFACSRALLVTRTRSWWGRRSQRSFVSRNRACIPSARQNERPAAGHSAVVWRRRSVPRRRSASRRHSPLRHSAAPGTLAWRRSTPLRRDGTARRSSTRRSGNHKGESFATILRLWEHRRS
jgi:hypothetical protein